MLPKIDFTQTSAYTTLKEYFNEFQSTHLKDLFQSDSKRFQQFSLEWEGILFDYSKNRIDHKIMELLLQMAKECKLQTAIKSLFNGEAINETENRAVMHMALRNLSQDAIQIDGKNVNIEIKQVLTQMRRFTDGVIAGSRTGFTKEPFTDVVNIGIGGSDLGPYMVTEALKPYKNHLRMHYVSNIDGTHIHETLKDLNPRTTLFLIASKTFTTQETMTNAATARAWFLKEGEDYGATEASIRLHFAALSTNTEAVKTFGIAEENQFPFWDWVGGRYSLWSSIGLSIALSVGFDQFEELLEGAHEADQHFQERDFSENIPVIMGLLGVWYTHFFDARTHAILPYDQYLHRFPAYCQQLEMESNGKSINRNGERVSYQTAPVIWGEPGTNGQHAFYQLIHQGTQLVPTDFIAVAQGQHPLKNHHHMLLSNFFAQTEALMNGTSHPTDPYRTFEGNKPSTSILIDRLTPHQLGKLIALYEHKVFVQGVLWNIYSVDEWGVELGKKLANQILQELQDNSEVNSHDTSTNGLINQYKNWSDIH